MQSFVVGRYNFNSLFKEEANETFIRDLFKEPYIDEEKFEYALGNITTEEYQEVRILRGTFGRMRKGGMAEIYDKDKMEFKKEELPEFADAILEFIIIHEYHLIFVEYNSIITPHYFANKFSKIYSNASSLADLEIEYIFLEKDVYETIKTWETVDRVVFNNLRPSNPSSTDTFRDIEKLLKDANSGKADITLRAPKSKKTTKFSTGLNADSMIIRQGLALSSHGYGEAKFEGIEKKKRAIVETKRFLKRVDLNFQEEKALDMIVRTIKEVSNK
jgi:hypothetical protein